MKNGFNFSILMSFLIIGTTLFSQNNLGTLDDVGRIALTAFVPDQAEELTASVKMNLENKLNQIASLNGMGSSVLSNRFIISSNVVILTKDITATAPPMFAYTLEVSLFIGDGIEGTLFSSTSRTLKGVGKSEAKAYITALNNFKPSDASLKSFIEKGKNKIIEYYNSKCDFILQEAQTLAQNRDFDAAIAHLVATPDVCKECYDKAMNKAVEVYKSKLELECQQNISKANASIAQNEWEEAASHLDMITPDLGCYMEASKIIIKIRDHQCEVDLGKAKGAWASRNVEETAKYLANVSNDSKCASEASALSSQIGKSLDEAARKRWELAYEKYNRDQILKENRHATDITLDNRRMDQQDKRLDADIKGENRRMDQQDKRLDADIKGENRRMDQQDKRLDADISNERAQIAMQKSQQEADIKMANRKMDYDEKQGYKLEQKRIEAVKAIGVAYGKNQQKTNIVNYNVNGWY